MKDREERKRRGKEGRETVKKKNPVQDKNKDLKAFKPSHQLFKIRIRMEDRKTNLSHPKSSFIY